jgi:pectin methylesterase-like acyl-CoA thioesterase
MFWKRFLNYFRSAGRAGGKAAAREARPRVEPLEDRRLLATYNVGPGLAYPSVNAVPWERLAPGDTVRIHWRPAAYHEKVLISTSGTAQQPIRVLGVPGPHGELPVIDGRDATTRAQASYPYAGTQDRGLVTITRDTRQPYGFKPGYIDIEGLVLRDASPLYTFHDARGATRTYATNAASVFVERGEHVTIRNCTITGSANGLFVASGDEEALVSRDILVEGDTIYGNGNAGSDRQHNVYTEASGCVFQYNRLGPLRPGALGSAIKDRSAGTVIRYNWVQGGARLLDLVDPEDSPDLLTQEPGFHDTYVYGNVFVDGPHDADTLIHYGGDSGVTSIYRKGTLHFYNNTVVVKADQQQHYNTTLLEPSTNDEDVAVYNNILYTQPATPGATPTQFNLVKSYGTVDVGTNWVSPGWLVSSAYGGFQGTITGTGNIIPSAGGANQPGFVNVAANDFHLAGTSPAIDRSQLLDAAATAAGYGVSRQYVYPHSGGARAVTGAAPDLGAFERAGAPAPPGAVLYVDGRNTTGTSDGSGARPFTTVQTAVNAATPGATIDVAAGTYLENVVVPDRSLTLLGGFAGGTSAGYALGQPGDFSTRDPGTYVTRITAASAADPVVYLANVTARTIRVDGFTISGGSHGVYVVADYLRFSNVTISHNVIEGNGPADLEPGGGTYMYYGGGIYSSNATITIANNVIRNNNANRGGGLHVSSRSDYTITGNLIDGNTGWDDHAGGIELSPLPISARGNGTFSHNTISNNVASKAFDYGWGGGILVAGNLKPSSLKPVRLSYNTWTGNYAPSVGGAIFADNGARVVLDHELIYNNHTQNVGGAAIYVDGDGSGVGSFLTVLNCTVADNSSSGDDHGNGVYVEEYSRVWIKNSIFWGNSQDIYVAPDGTGSRVFMSYTDTQQGWAGVGNLRRDPLFADPAAGDYHEKSARGRWDPAARGGAGAWVVDAVTSPAIDAGDPASAYSREPAPNGRRINLGVYGDTAQASRSPSRRRP